MLFLNNRMQWLEVGIAMTCSISPNLFMEAFEVILIGARQVVSGENRRKWKAKEEVQKAIGRLPHQQVDGPHREGRPQLG